MNKLKRFSVLACCCALMCGVSGCSSTMKVVAAPDVEFEGNYRSRSLSLNVSGKGSAVYRLSGDRLDECEFRKMNSEQELQLVIRSGLFSGSMHAPAGTAGLRATRDGLMNYRLQLMP
jgi:hypothetical protein